MRLKYTKEALSDSEIIRLLITEKEELILDFDKLANYNYNLTEELISEPEEVISLIEEKARELNNRFVTIRFTNLPKSTNVLIRQLRARHLDVFITIEGVIRQASNIRPIVKSSRFECMNCGAILKIDNEKNRIRCSCGNKTAFSLLSQELVDNQKIVIEETLDSLDSLGSQPQRINVFLEGSLVDPKMEKRAIPGNKVVIYGIPKQYKLETKGLLSERREVVIHANNIIATEQDADDLKISEEEIKQFEELSIDPKILDKFSKGLAPSIYGLEEIKKTIVLQLFGGVRQKKSDNSYTRGSIHLLLVGDAGTSKSVLIRNASNILPRARFVSGKSASGAGLTGAVIRDELTGQYMLEAGAMALANKSILVVDEIDKMNDNDRQNLHEALEQQTVSFSKAGVQVSLTTQTSMLAAANPKLGRFDNSKEFNLLREVNLSPPLLSRFDCIFIIRDTISKEKDELIADKILSEHGDVIHEEVMSHDFMKKYVVYARKLEPKLTKECKELIKQFYVSFRLVGKDKQIVQITPRQLDGIIRLTQAHARMCLREYTTEEDARVAIGLVKESLQQVGLRLDGLIDSSSISGGSLSQKNKALMVKDIVYKLCEESGGMIYYKKIEEAIQSKLTPSELSYSLDLLSKAGEIYSPKTGYYSKLG